MSSSSSLPIYIVDAFTTQPFKGNQAAVCLWKRSIDKNGSFLSDPSETMQRIASEMNLSETSFVVPSNLSVGFHFKFNLYMLDLFDVAICFQLVNADLDSLEFELRWFTPTVEVPLCGHATLATAHVIFHHLLIDISVAKAWHPFLSDKPGNQVKRLRFQTRSGLLEVNLLEKGALRMNFPQGNPLPIPSLRSETLNGLLIGLSIPKIESILEFRHCAITRKLLLEVDSVETVNNLKLNQASLIPLNFGSLDVKGIIVTTKGRQETDQSLAFDFISRYFAPWLGIPEDPVTGSAHTVLSVYWSKKLNKQHLRAYQASPRGGELRLILYNDASKDDNGRVYIEGQATTFLVGHIHIEI